VKLAIKNPMRAAVRQVRNRFAHKAVILTYHRIGKFHIDPWGLFVSSEHFREHLEILRDHGSVLSLNQLLDSLKRGRLPRRAIAVTFDDGYSDWFDNAKPLLEHFAVPATLFLISGKIGEKAALWWDELQKILLQSDRLPETLELRIKGRTHSWALGDAARFDNADRTHSSWKASEDPPTVRHATYFTLWKVLRTLGNDERQAIMSDLRAWAGSATVDDHDDSLLSPEQIVSAAASNLFDIGSHSVTHPSFAAISLEAQRDEIERSKSQLGKLLGRPVGSFACPYGNYTAETPNMLREAGFVCACCTRMGTVKPNTDWYELPRVQVDDCDGVTFARQLSRWFSSD
jgi:peptidoglycan/xylan/chitin deacetylase (PgdA/CDA1 family)